MQQNVKLGWALNNVLNGAGNQVGRVLKILHCCFRDWVEDTLDDVKMTVLNRVIEGELYIEQP